MSHETHAAVSISATGADGTTRMTAWVVQDPRTAAEISAWLHEKLGDPDMEALASPEAVEEMADTSWREMAIMTGTEHTGDTGD